MKLHHLLFAFALIAFFASCQSTYIPCGPNVPLMSEGDELQVAMSVGSNGYGAQLAYSPYYHWAIAANGNTFTVLGGNGRDPNDVTFRHFNGEASTGYYTRLSKFARLEILAGYGAGQTGIPDINQRFYRKAFLQPSLGISSPYLDFGFTPRITWVDQTVWLTEFGGRRKMDEAWTFMEPTVTVRAGYELFKFQMQGSLAIPFGKSPFTYRKSFLSFGFHLTFVKDFEKYR